MQPRGDPCRRTVSDRKGGELHSNVLSLVRPLRTFVTASGIWPQPDDSVLLRTGFKQVPNWDLKPSWEGDKPQFLQPVPRTGLFPPVVSVKIPAT